MQDILVLGASRLWLAIRITTAARVCSVIDIALAGPTQYTGFVARGEAGHQRISAGE